MLNLIRMDLYRLWKTKSMYVIWLILVVMFLGSTCLLKSEMYQDVSQALESQTDEGEMASNFGISVNLPTKLGERVTVYDGFYGNAQGMAIALMIGIFAVLFSTADASSGYIKNIGGQVKHRYGMILSRALVLLVFTILTMGIAVLAQAASNQLVLGYLEWGDLPLFAVYLVTQILLHFALGMICMAVAILLRNNLWSMIFAVCLCMNLMQLIYGLLDKLVHKMGDEDFAIGQYTVTGKIARLPLEITLKSSVNAVIVSVAFVLGALVLTSAVFEKRDIV